MMIVHPGTAVPHAHSHPAFEVLEITDRAVRIRVAGAAEPVAVVWGRVTGPPETRGEPRVKLNAIAGEAPDYVAVIEYEGQIYVGNKGTEVPEVHPVLVITAVTPTTVTVRDLATGASSHAALAPDE